MTEDLVQLFLDAVRVDAVSLHERPMADFVRRILADQPIDIHEDACAPRFQGECGNLICIPRGFDPSRPALALLAHIDTPRSTADVRPMITDTQISSDGTTALGVDNRAGVSVLLHALRTAKARDNRANYIVVFTVAEEAGPFGSRYVDLVPYNIRMCFVFDCSKRPGTFIQAAVGCSTFTATFVGRTAHAGVTPERGINAIHSAATAVSRIRVGRLSPTMTASVGIIGGGSATNVVPDRCMVSGEVREFARAPIEEHLRSVEDTFRRAATESGGDLEFRVIDEFAPFRLGNDAPAVRLTTEVLRALDLTPNGIDYLGGSDANMLNANGIPSVNLGIGAQNPHGNDEFILLEDLHTAAAMASSFIQRSASLI